MSAIKNYAHIGLILFFGVFSTFYNATLPLYLDEAYYWLWSKHLDIGYLDHPFIIALFIKAATLFGDTTQVVRLVSVFCFSLAAYFVYLTAKRAFDYKTAVVALLIFLCSPAANMGFTITSPDSPLILFWAAALYFSYIAFFEKKAVFYILAGSAVGLGMSSKYTAVLFLGFLGLFLLIRRTKEILNYKPWVAIVFVLIFFAPTLFWNYQNDWASFAYQFKHGTNEAFRVDWKHFFEFFGGLFLLFSPVLFGYFLFLSLKIREWFKDEKLFFFFLSGTFVILFFLYKGLFLKMQLNWVAPAFVGLSIFTASFIVKFEAKKILILSLAISIFFSFIIRFPSSIGLKGEQNFHSRIYGYKELADEINKISFAEDKIFADHLTLASILSFYLYSHGEAMIPTPSRPSMFSYWHKDVNFGLLGGIYASEDESKEQLAKIWQNVELIEIFQTSSAEFKKKKFYIYRVSN